MNREIADALEVLLHLVRVLERGHKLPSDDIELLKGLIESIKFPKRD